MLTEVKNQFRVSLLSIKYNIMKEMTNKASFISNIIFMVINNALFLVEWFVLFSIKNNIGGLTLKEMMLLWGFAAGTYGVSRFFFSGAFSLSKAITDGKLDTFLIQPKNILIQLITTEVSVSALGDMLYAYIIYFIYGFTIPSFLLFTVCMIMGGLVLTALAVIYGSLAFYITNAEDLADSLNNNITTFTTYPEKIFKGGVRLLLYTVVPVGLTSYIPHTLVINFNPGLLILFIIISIMIIALAFLIFNKGLKKYTSTNLMVVRI